MVSSKRSLVVSLLLSVSLVHDGSSFIVTPTNKAFLPKPAPAPAPPTTTTEGRKVSYHRSSGRPWQSSSSVAETVTTTNDADNGDQPADEDNKKNKKRRSETFYDVLGVATNVDRTTLKHQYMKLAKLTHPDAMIGQNKTSDELDDNIREFVEISEAYRVLSNPKLRRKYDRSLQAEDFVESVEQVASSWTQAAAPQVEKVLKNYALPLFRRTTATTFASVSAIAQDISRGRSNGSSVDLGSAVNSAIAAGMKAGQLLDRLELKENSVKLRELASQELDKAQSLEEKLWDVAGKRLSLTLRLDDAPLSSRDAIEVLDHLAANMTANDALKLRSSLNTEISHLQQVELDFNEKSKVQQYALESLQKAQDEMEQAERLAAEALAEEREALRAWERAQKKVAQYKEATVNWGKECSSRQFLERRAHNDLVRVNTTLTKRQDRLRKVLYKKQKSVCSQDDNDDDDDDDDDDEEAEEEGAGEQVVQYLEELMQAEARLMEEHAALETSAAKLQLRAETLESRAEMESSSSSTTTTTTTTVGESVNGQAKFIQVEEHHANSTTAFLT